MISGVVGGGGEHDPTEMEEHLESEVHFLPWHHM